MEKEKSRFILWVEHVWWAYKWMIIILGLIAVFVVVAIVSSITNTDPDVNLMYIGPLTLSESIEAKLNDSVKDMIPDANGDGKKHIGLFELAAESRYYDMPVLESGDYVSDGEVILADTSRQLEYSRVLLDADTDDSTLERYKLELMVGDSTIFFIEEYYYDIGLDMGIFAKLEDTVDSELIPEDAKDEYSVYLKDLAIYSLPGFSSMDGNTVVCIRAYPDTAKGELTYGRSYEQYLANVEFFKALLGYTD